MVKRLLELYEYRELLIALVIKELKVKYKNSALGFFWSLLNPLLQMLVFTFIFSFVFRAGVKDFPIFFLTGFLPWNFFAFSLTRATASIIENANLIKKVYFPREIIPLSIILANLVNFALELLVLFVFLIIYGYNFLPFFPLLLFAIVLEVLMMSGFSFALASSTVYFRDLQQLINILLMVWFYGTAVIYPINMVPAVGQVLVKYVNPVTSLIMLYREALYNLNFPHLSVVLYATATSVFIFVAGYWLFSKLSASFAKEV